MSIVPTANPNQQLPQSQQQPQQQQQQITTSTNNNTNTINTSSSTTSSSNLSQRNSSENNNTSTTTITSPNQQSSQQQQPSLPTNLSVSALSNMATKPVSQRTNTNNTSQILSIASMIPAATTASKSQQQSTSNLTTNTTTNNTTSKIANNNNLVTSTNGTNITSQMSQAQVGSSTPNTTTVPPQIPQQQQQQQQQIQPVYDDINIFMWSVCKICNKSTRKMAMSPDTWSFSLAKFLELTFHAHNYHQYNGPDEGAVCKHALFQDHYQYFRFKNVVTVFSTSKIIIKSLQIPELVLKSTVFDYRSNKFYIKN
jgi:hypothetical protein